MTRITDLRVFDLRFPTSQSLDGSDAMNPDPDYSAAYVILDTDREGLAGHGLTFTIGRGNDICCMAIKAMRHLIVGQETSDILTHPGRFWRHLTSDSQLRWIGPEKGAMHLATGAVVNAVWDLLAKEAGKPVWRLVALMSPEEIADIVDYRYMTDVLTRDEAVAILSRAEPGKAQRIATLEKEGYACYTTSAGWLGYDDDKLRRLAQEAIDEGFNHIKMKVGRDLADDIRRLTIAREVIGPDRYLMIDANQVWEVGEAIDWVKQLAFAEPFFIEEPTSPDDVAGHRKIREAIGPVKVATGEMCQNRIMFKQFIAEGAIDIVQIDSCRMGGPERGSGGAARRRQIRAAGLAACRWRRLVRICPASVDDRLSGGFRHQGWSRHRICRPSARTLPRPLRDRECRLHAAAAAGFLDRDETAVDRGLHVPRLTKASRFRRPDRCTPFRLLLVCGAFAGAPVDPYPLRQGS